MPPCKPAPKWLRAVATLSLLASALFLFAQLSAAQNKTPSETTPTAMLMPESYAVYSAILTERYRGWFSKGVPVMIASYTSLPGHNHGDYLAKCNSSAEDEIDRQLIHQLLSQGDRKEKIDANLDLPWPYLIVEKNTHIQNGVEPGVVSLSPVVFSQDKRRAMVWVSNYCGVLCGSGTLWRMVKSAKGWQANNYVPSCGFISSVIVVKEEYTSYQG